MRYYVIAGEASGDLHGSNLLKAIRKEDAEADFRAWGGDLMKEAGAVLVKHYRDLAFMGFTEVLMNLKVILKNLRFCKEDILKYSPDVLILIDYPGFNLRMAEFAHQNNIRVFYYISPQIWAWKQNRVYKIRKVVDRMYVILPFEQAFYARFNMDVTFVGHPLLDAIETYTHDATFRSRHSLDNRPIIALLPGSRQQEISKMLPVMLESIQALGDYLPVIAGAPSRQKSIKSGVGEQPCMLLAEKRISCWHMRRVRWLLLEQRHWKRHCLMCRKWCVTRVGKFHI